MPKTAVGNVSAHRRYLNVHLGLAWSRMDVDAVKCVPSNWANSALRKTFVTHTKDCFVTLAPGSTGKLESALPGKVPPVYLEAWSTEVESLSKAAASTNAHA